MRRLNLHTDTAVAVRAISLSKYYKSGENNLVIFDNLNLEIRKGERLALVGESGAGKSTLLHLLGGLDRPTKGEILFDGKDIAGLSESQRADFRNREIGFVWQTHYLLPEFTALENVTMPLLIRGVNRSEAMTAAAVKLGSVGLANRAHHRAGELSGGEQQRVVLARALAGNPKVLLADEPTGSLDYRTGEKIADLFDEVHQLHRLTSVFVTHNLGFAKRCDRILKLECGVLVSQDGDVPPLPSCSSEKVENRSLAALQRKEPPGDTARGEDGKNYV